MLEGGRDDGPARSRLVRSIERQLDESESATFDIDAVLDEELSMPERPAPLVTMNDLDRVIASPALMTPGTQVRALGSREYALRAPGMSDELLSARSVIDGRVFGLFDGRDAALG